ncbi:MAG: hypothetical protein KF798_06590, partial [Candidatus Paracaedibacteraceae bacterium]|nr:hypothetical protein [Candidatus Paracaedibacteraceae bacterium]
KKADVKPQYGHTLHAPNYMKKYLNGAYVKSHGKLKLETPESDVLVHYGQVLSVGGIEFVVKDLIKNLSGVIMSHDDIILRGKRYLQTRPDLMQFNANIYGEWHDQIYYLEQADPADLTTMGSLFLFLEEFENQYSDVLVAKSLFWDNREIPIKGGTTALKNISRDQYYTEIYSYKVGKRRNRSWRDDKLVKNVHATVATMKVGEDLEIFGGNVDNSGAINARTINLDLDSFTSSCLGGRSTGHRFGTLQFDISQMIEDAKNDPAAAAFMGETCLEGDEAKEAFGGLSPDYLIYKLVTNVCGRANLLLTDGSTVAGMKMIQFLEKNGRKIAQGLKDQITALYWEQTEINKRLQPRLKLYIAPDDVNPHHGSGDVTGEKIHIRTTGDQTYNGGTVHANTTTVLETESNINASNTDISGDDGVAAKAKNIKAETLAHRIYHENGYTDVVRDEMRFTSKYGPALLISFANMVLNGTFVSAASTGVKVGGNSEFGTTELHSESTTYWKKHTFHKESTDHHRTRLHAHGNTRPTAPQTGPQSPQPQPSPSPNPNRTVYEDGVTIEDEEETPPARKPYHPKPEFLRTTEPDGYQWDESAYQRTKAPLRSAMKDPRRPTSEQGTKKTVRFAEESAHEEQDIFADSAELGCIDIETEGNSIGYGVEKKAVNKSAAISTPSSH